MKPRKPAPHLTPLERMFQFHKRSCSYYRFSDGDKRLTQCSCGRNEAEAQYQQMLEQIRAGTLVQAEFVTDYPHFCGSVEK